MPVESWTQPDDVPALAALATARIDAVLTRLDAAGRAAFWASITKCYNTPYNDPAPRSLVFHDAPQARPAAEIRLASGDGAGLAALAALPRPAAFGADHHAG